MPKAITIQDAQSKTEATIHVDRGSNCYSFRVPHDGDLVEVLWNVPDFASGGGRPSSSGIPILFPFPGRIKEGRFAWNGKNYTLEKNDRLGNAIHGFVYDRSWRVINQSRNRLETQFKASVDLDAFESKWPADFEISATFEIAASKLDMTFNLVNPGDTDLPFGLGLHPYFRVPMIQGSSPDDILVKMPVQEKWDLDEKVPTGNRVAVDPPDHFAAGQRFGDLSLDAVFTNQASTAQEYGFEVFDPHSSRQLQLTCDVTFPYTVAFTPPHREAICIEPYTCVPGAIRLQGDEINAGLRILKPQETFSARMSLFVK